MVKHQHLPTEAPRAQFESVIVIPERVAAFEPFVVLIASLQVLGAIDRYLRQVVAAFAVIEQQMKVEVDVLPATVFQRIQL
ncbi:hypothetical protein D3C76_1419870 [compost metagenome]